MNSDPIFLSHSTRKKGRLIYESEAIMPGKKNSVRAALYETMVVVDHMCIEYSFDLKFTMKEGEIVFDKYGQTESLVLPRNDEKKWRDVLKNHLNQRGFH